MRVRSTRSDNASNESAMGTLFCTCAFARTVMKLSMERFHQWSTKFQVETGVEPAWSTQGKQLSKDILVSGTWGFWRYLGQYATKVETMAWSYWSRKTVPCRYKFRDGLQTIARNLWTSTNCYGSLFVFVRARQHVDDAKLLRFESEESECLHDTQCSGDSPTKRRQLLTSQMLGDEDH